MSAVHPIEIELTKATKLRPPENRGAVALRKFRMLIVQEADKFSNEDFDLLSHGSQTWLNAAVEAVLDNQTVPEFSIADSAVAPAEAEPAALTGKPGTDAPVTVSTDASDTGAVPDDEPPAVTIPEPVTKPVSPIDENKQKEANTPKSVKTVNPVTEGGTKTQVKVTPAAATKPTASPPAPQPAAKPAKAQKDILAAPRTKGAGYRAKELMIQHGIAEFDDVIIAQLRQENLRMSSATLQTIRYEFKQALALLQQTGLLNEKEFYKVYGKGK